MRMPTEPMDMIDLHGIESPLMASAKKIDWSNIIIGLVLATVPAAVAIYTSQKVSEYAMEATKHDLEVVRQEVRDIRNILMKKSNE